MCRSDCYMAMYKIDQMSFVHAPTINSTNAATLIRPQRRKNAGVEWIQKAIRDLTFSIRMRPSSYLSYLYRGGLLLKKRFWMQKCGDSWCGEKSRHWSVGRFQRGLRVESKHCSKFCSSFVIVIVECWMRGVVESADFNLPRFLIVDVALCRHLRPAHPAN